MKTSEAPLVDLLTAVYKRCEKESELYSIGSSERIPFLNFLDELADMISHLKRMESWKADVVKESDSF